MYNMKSKKWISWLLAASVIAAAPGTAMVQPVRAEVTSDVVGYGDTKESGYVLNSLSITRGSGTEVELYPAFSADTQSYTATVTHYDNTTNTVQPDKLIFRAIPAAEDAVVTLNYTNNYTSVPVSVVLDHTGAAATADYCLHNGVNEFTITVAPPEGQEGTAHTYQFAVTRNLSLSSLTVTTDKSSRNLVTFDPVQMEYDIQVPANTEQVTVSAAKTSSRTGSTSMTVDGANTTRVTKEIADDPVKVEIVVTDTSQNLTSTIQVNITRKQLTAEEKQKVENLIAALDSLGTVSLERKTQVEELRASYDALSDEAKEVVTNYSILLDAESIINTLEYAVEYPLSSTAFDWPEFLGHADLPGVSYAKTPISQEQIKERWKINSTSLLGDAATTGWNATPGTPILVGDYMYCYLDQRIWKIELATGKAVGSARVYGTSINQFFIYLAYGDGKIFMPCKANSLGDVDVSGSFIRVFDADTMQQLYVTEAIDKMDMQTPIMCHDGYITTATYVNGSYVCFDTVDEDPDSSTEVKSALWKKTGIDLNVGTSYEGKQARFSWNASAFVGDCIYFGNNSQNIFYAVNFKTGEVVDTLDLDGVNKAKPYYCKEDERLYISHNEVGANGSCAGITAIKLNEDGTFNRDSRSEWKSDYSGGGTQSSPVIYNGRIYLGGGGGTMGSNEPVNVIDAETMTTIYSIDDIKTKGSAAVSTAYATEENHQQVYVYFVPYDGKSQKMWVISDCEGQTEPNYEVWTGIGQPEYCSQSIDIAEDGSLIWYNDLGYIYCYENTGDTGFTGDEIQSRITSLPDVKDITSYFYPSEIAQIKSRYDALNEEEKEKVDAGLLEKMEAAAGKTPAERMTEVIKMLPDMENIRLADKEAVDMIQEQYHALNDSQKAKVTNASALELAQAAIQDLLDARAVLEAQTAKAEAMLSGTYSESAVEKLRAALEVAEKVDTNQASVSEMKDAAAELKKVCDDVENQGTDAPVFEDVKEGDWYYEAVRLVSGNGIMTGMGDAAFQPFENLTRAQAVVILYRMNGKTDVEYQELYPDVEDETWYTDAVMWASENKIVNGYTDTGLFAPAKAVSREEFAVMLYRYAQYKGDPVSEEADLNSFRDGNEVSSFAQEAMKWAVGAGIIKGKDNGTFVGPQGSANRAEGAAMIQRYLEKGIK